MKQHEVKKLYGHNLVKSYLALPGEKRTLSSHEFDVLERANDIYRKKDFEYFNVLDVVTGYSRYPDLEPLAELAKKLTRYE